MIEIIINIICLLASLYCLYTDIKYKSIYNKITFPLMGTGIILNVFAFGLNGLKNSLIGILVGFFLLIAISIFIKGIGYGDLKLLMAIGALKGYRFTLDTILIAIVSCFIIQLIFNAKKLIEAIRIDVFMIYNFFTNKTVYQLDFNNTVSNFIFGPYIVLGAFFSMIITKGNLIFFLIGK